MDMLLMLMTIGGIILAAGLFVVALYTGKAWLAKFVAGGVMVWFAFYTVMLLGASFMSRDRLLEQNEPKEFCGFYFDCHMHASVTDVKTARTIGDRAAKGIFYIVTVKVFSNARRATLGLLTVDAHVLDSDRRKYERDPAAELQLPPQPEFEEKIGPTESFEKQIVFDLPTGVNAPRLDIREGYGIDHAIEAVLIDDEDSIFHGRNYFELQKQNQPTGVN